MKQENEISLRDKLRAKIRAGHCLDDTEDGDVNFCGDCDWCLHILADRAMSHEPSLEFDVREAIRNAKVKADKKYGIAWNNLEEVSRFELFLNALVFRYSSRNNNSTMPLRIVWNKHDLAKAYDLVEGVRRSAAQPTESPLNTSLLAALDAIESADCEWDGITKS